MGDHSQVVGYIRVSTTEQADSGLGLEAQRAAIDAECARRHWELVEMHEDAGASGRSLKQRPGLSAALAAVDEGRAGTLMVAKLDRLSRSLVDFAGLMADAQRRAWNLVAMDLGIDLSTPSGEFMASVMASAAQWERRIIGQRTKDALAVRRAQGVRLGRPKTLPQPIVDRVIVEREAGHGWTAIARSLEADGVPTAQGGRQWYPATVRQVYLSATG
jgi:DNA invertase Pin-like site-specific DNA recombinase